MMVFLKIVGSFLLKYWLHIVVGLLLVFVTYKLYYWAHDNGAESVQLQWDAQKVKDTQAMQDLKDKLSIAEGKHRKETIRISNEISEAKRIHDVELARADAEFQRRLQISESRGQIYKRQAQGGTLTCASLGEHTAKLDSSLEEGRSLVRELGETLRLRERQLISVGEQLLNDRKLLTEDTGQDDGK